MIRSRATAPKTSVHPRHALPAALFALALAACDGASREEALPDEQASVSQGLAASPCLPVSEVLCAVAGGFYCLPSYYMEYCQVTGTGGSAGAETSRRLDVLTSWSGSQPRKSSTRQTWALSPWVFAWGDQMV